MGIKDLNTFLNKYCPDQINNTIEVNTLSGSTLAIDVLNYLYKLLKTSNNWLDGFVQFLDFFIQNNIKIVCVFDSKETIEAKMSKRNERDISLKNNKYKLKKIIKFIKYFQNVENDIENEEDKNIIKIKKKEKKDNIESVLKLFPKCDIDNKTSIKDIIRFLKYKKDILEKCVRCFSKDDMKSIFKTCDDMNIIYIKCKVEAETVCAYLAKEKHVKYVLSEDSDMYAYGTKFFLTKYNMYTHTANFINIKKIYKKLGDYDFHMFLSLCILLGNDYNNRLKGFGPVKCYKTIESYKYLKDIPKSIISREDIKKLNIKTCNNIFNNNCPNDIINEYIPLVFKQKTIEYFDTSFL